MISPTGRLIGRTLAATGTILLTVFAVVGGYLAASTPSRAAITTTAWDAHRQLIEHVQAVADAQPAGTVFTDRLPEYPHAVLGSAALPADEDGTNSDQPYSYSVDYWVLPVAGWDTWGTTGFTRLVSAMREQGWSIDLKESGFAVGTTTDGYDIVVRTAAGHVTIGGQSPNFPRSQMDRDAVWPSQLASRREA